MQLGKMATIVTIKGEPVIDIYESFDGSYWFITEKCHKQDSVIGGKVYKDDQILFGYARLSACPEFAEFGYISETELKLLGNRVWKVPKRNWPFCPEVDVQDVADKACLEDASSREESSSRSCKSCSILCKEVNETMAFRPTRYLIEGELDNATLGKVTGWMTFAGMKDRVVLDLKGDFHRDIRGTKIKFWGDARENEEGAKEYMEGFWCEQTGKAGDMTAGFEPADYVKGRCYLEWYSRGNGRVVIELKQSQVKVIGTPIRADQCEPISREEQARNMDEFLTEIARSIARQRKAA